MDLAIYGLRFRSDSALPSSQATFSRRGVKAILKFELNMSAALEANLDALVLLKMSSSYRKIEHLPADTWYSARLFTKDELFINKGGVISIQQGSYNPWR